MSAYSARHSLHLFCCPFRTRHVVIATLIGRDPATCAVDPPPMPPSRKPDIAAGRRLLASAAFRSRCEARLGECLDGEHEVDLLSLASVDGRSVAFAQRAGAQAGRIAALSATLISVSESLAREVNGDRVEHALLALRHGVIVSCRVRDCTGVFTLSLLGRGSINLALALRLTLDLAERLAGDIDADVRLGEPSPTHAA